MPPGFSVGSRGQRAAKWQHRHLLSLHDSLRLSAPGENVGRGALCPPACFEPTHKNWLVPVSTRTWARATAPLLGTATTLDLAEHSDVLGDAFFYNFAERPRRVSPALPCIF